jgi:hypothetical protein
MATWTGSGSGSGNVTDGIAVESGLVPRVGSGKQK